jgi:hypothetical protein
MTKALAPALVDTIKSAGLVLVSDVSGTAADVKEGPRNRLVSDKVDGTIHSNGVLLFRDNIDMSSF